MTDQPKLLSTLEAAAVLNYSRQYISHLVRRGELDGRKYSRDVLVTEQSVRAYQKKYHGQHRTRGRKPTIAPKKKMPTAGSQSIRAKSEPAV